MAEAGRSLARLSLVPLLALAACHKADDEPGPVTAPETQALDRAGEMIRDQTAPTPAPDPTATD